MKKKWLLVTLGIIFLSVWTFGTVAMAINMYHEKVAGLGKWEWTDEVAVDEIEPETLDDQVKVKLEPTGNTVADNVYGITLELDDVASGSDSVSWTAAEISSLTKKTVIFTGLTLSSTTVVEVKVVP